MYSYSDETDTGTLHNEEVRTLVQKRKDLLEEYKQSGIVLAEMMKNCDHTFLTQSTTDYGAYFSRTYRCSKCGKKEYVDRKYDV